ncbi:MAG: flagellar hook-basal body complex protein [Vampirovibrionales bacterium]|nr:flagellar hook-basal body complex protein [Vampirovibrionales bacterium]
MYDPFVTSINTQKTVYDWFSGITQNLGNMYTPGYRQQQNTFHDFLNGVQSADVPKKADQGKSIPGRGPTSLFIEGSGFFLVRKNDGALRYTRLGDFTFNKDGTLVTHKGDKVQGYLLDDQGQVVNGTNASSPQGNGLNQTPNNIPTTEITLWVDPSNGKFLGKYDEYKIRSDGTVVGIADKGNTIDPLYKIGLANFINPAGLTEIEDYHYVATDNSGPAAQGTGEIRSGLLESSNVDTDEQVSQLRQAKMQLDVTNKVISTNKSLLEEALRLIQ